MVLTDYSDSKLEDVSVDTGRVLARLTAVCEMEGTLDRQLELLEAELTLNERKFVVLDALDTQSVVMTTLLGDIHKARRLILDLKPVLREFCLERMALQTAAKMMIRQKKRRPAKPRPVRLIPRRISAPGEGDKENLARLPKHLVLEGSPAQRSSPGTHPGCPPRHHPYQRRQPRRSRATDRYSVSPECPAIALGPLSSIKENTETRVQLDAAMLDSGARTSNMSPINSDLRFRENDKPQLSSKPPVKGFRNFVELSCETASECKAFEPDQHSDRRPTDRHYTDRHHSDLQEADRGPTDRHHSDLQEADRGPTDRHHSDQQEADRHPADREDDAPF